MRVFALPEPRTFTITAVVAMALGLMVAGCQPAERQSTAPRPAVQPDELAAHDGEVCPRYLPGGDDPGGHGFGVEAAAVEMPSLLTPEMAWTCRYDPVEAGPAPGGGTMFKWVRRGQARSLDRPTVRELEKALDHLSLLEGERACTADLGPRWMIVYTHEGDLTGVVVDDYGCRDVRLTDEPFTTPPGSLEQEESVGGTFGGGADLFDQLKVGRSHRGTR
jgi:hypothetical protein